MGTIPKFQPVKLKENRTISLQYSDLILTIYLQNDIIYLENEAYEY